MTIAALALIGVLVAAYLTLYKVGAIGHLACGLGSCERVNTSRWATFLGAPVAAWGLAFYAVTFIVALAGTSVTWIGRREISVVLTAMSAAGVAFSAWLTYLELYVIGAVCRYCVVSAVIVVLILLMSIADLRRSATVVEQTHQSRTMP